MLFLKHKPAAPTELGIHGLRFRAGIEEQISGGNDEPTVANGLSPEEMAGQDIHFYDFRCKHGPLLCDHLQEPADLLSAG